MFSRDYKLGFLFVSVKFNTFLLAIGQNIVCPDLELFERRAEQNDVVSKDDYRGIK